jgi:nicotinate phosphoribosyltransferase
MPHAEQPSAQRDDALLVDLYQLTMMQAYREREMDAIAVFEFFVRKLPQQRNFLLAAGLEQVLDYLEHLRFTEKELDWLSRCGHFSGGFVDSLADFRFRGDVDAMPEGSVFFPDEPILRVVAPLSQAQFVETRIINLLQFQVLVASKAARCVLAAPGRRLVDFGLRRSHGSEAGLLSARAAYLAGFDGSSTVAAGMRFGIPLFGTMAHSFVQAHDRESDALEHFARAFPEGSTMLIDTYDTEAAARHLVPLIHRLATEGVMVRAVRLDSGDLAAHALRVRAILDAGGLHQVQIFASGSLDEQSLREIVARGAPIDGFGVGTRLNTSADAPYFDCAYKLQEYDGVARRKRSEGKATWPGRKQVYRQIDRQGRIVGDMLTLVGDPQPGAPLLAPVMRGGRRIAPSPTLDAVREHARGQLASLPEALRALDPAAPYPVVVSPALRALADAVDRRIASA